MKLNQHEAATPLWQKLMEYYAIKIAAHRTRLENPRIPESERLELCWKIASIKELFALAEPEQKK